MDQAPPFQGYSVDRRAREFRRLEPDADGAYDVIPFDSEAGERMLWAMIEEAFGEEDDSTEG